MFIESIIRSFLVRLGSKIIPLYIVNEYPKSGGTWIGLMLGDALGVPFPRNQIPRIAPSIMHGHYLHPHGMDNIVCIWRDGRDVMVSWYYHCLIEAGYHNRKIVEYVRSILKFDDYEDIENNLPRFIEYTFTRQKHPNFSWTDFVNQWIDNPRAIHVYYEKVREDCANEIKRIAKELCSIDISDIKAKEIEAKYEFECMSGRKPGTENRKSFMRKGIVGDWKNSFTKEAREVFSYYAGQEIIKLGYETDKKWV